MSVYSFSPLFTDKQFIGADFLFTSFQTFLHCSLFVTSHKKSTAKYENQFTRSDFTRFQTPHLLTIGKTYTQVLDWLGCQTFVGSGNWGLGTDYCWLWQNSKTLTYFLASVKNCKIQGCQCCCSLWWFKFALRLWLPKRFRLLRKKHKLPISEVKKCYTLSPQRIDERPPDLDKILVFLFWEEAKAVIKLQLLC